jgi:hypothetical protein
MLEIRRDTYLTEPAGELLAGQLEALATSISGALSLD